MATPPPLVIWSVVSKTSSFKRTSVNHTTLSADPLNVEGQHSFRSSGLAQRSVVGIRAFRGVSTLGKKGSGFAVVTTDAVHVQHPSKFYKEVELSKSLKKGVDAVMSTASSVRKDLVQPALARYSRVRKAGLLVKDTSAGGKRQARAGGAKPSKKAAAANAGVDEDEAPQLEG